jgi:hypothetical protein
MTRELTPLGDRAWLDSVQKRCGDVTWMAGWKDYKHGIATIIVLDHLVLTDLKRGDHVELVISGDASGEFAYYVHPDMGVANQPIDLQSQSPRRVRADYATGEYRTIHGVAVFVLTDDVGPGLAHPSVKLTWYLEGKGPAYVEYSLQARVLRAASASGS